MTEQLSRTFVTPLEREDIEAISFAPYRIPKQIEKIVERIAIYPGKLPPAPIPASPRSGSQPLPPSCSW